ncbi:hypothetical protein AB0953_10460 [Streptomyces sp. NPDC046866]|uniref:hypothetical protein n=1 Tax=Streptomyces sp. NPDC046866 TaxID=3154921 RepID=UPI0034563BCB
MRTTTSTAAAALAGAVLLSTAACAPLSGKTASAPASRPVPATPSPTADPLAGQDSATVLRRAYEETQRVVTQQALLDATVDERKFQAYLTVGSDGNRCEGSVTTILACAAEMSL